MSAPLLFPDPDFVPPAPIRLSVFSPEEGLHLPEKHRIANPVLHQNPAIPVDEMESFYRAMAAEHQDNVPVLSPAEKEIARRSWSIPHFYRAAIVEWRNSQKLSGQIRPRSLQKERQAISSFEAWDLSQVRPDWPAGVAWAGLPLRFISATYLERWITAALEKGMAEGSIKALWAHLRVILGWAVRLEIIPALPKVRLEALLEKFRERQNLEECDDADLVPNTYSFEQLETIYRALAQYPDLQVAWVLSAHAGPRTGDLFELRWEKNIRLEETDPYLIYRATKTGKRHWVPLSTEVILHLRRLIKLQGHLDPIDPQGMLFPGRTSLLNKDPEHSYAARQRNKLIKSILRDAGLPTTGDHNRPWQMLRATANSRWNNHWPGAGRLVTHGKDADPNSQSYWDHRDTLLKALKTLPFPAAFCG